MALLLKLTPRSDRRLQENELGQFVFTVFTALALLFPLSIASQYYGMQIMLIVKTLTKEVCSVTVSDLIGNEEKL